MRTLFVLILAALPLPQDEELRSFSSEEGNFKVSYPRTWRKMKPPRAEIQLALNRLPNIIMIAAAETPASIEAIVDSVMEEQKLIYDSFKVEEQKETRVAEERALSLRFAIKHTGMKCTMSLVVFTHHGISYRVIGVHSGGPAEEFLADFQKCLDTFEYIADRKEWVEKFEGRPAKSALLGGLATFDLRRPRWTETLDRDSEYGVLDEACFSFITQGAWITLRARESTGGIDSAADHLRHELASRLQKPKFTEAEIKVAAGEARAFSVTGEFGESTHILRGAVVDRDGVRLELWMDCQNSLREVTKPDWESLTASLLLHPRSGPPEPPAFPCRPQYAGNRPDPGVALFLLKARSLLETDRSQLLGVSPDGASAIVQSDGTIYRQVLGGKREKLALETAPQNPVAWSKDGKRIAYVDNDRVILADLSPVAVRTVPVAAESVQFGPGEGELLVCTKRPGNVLGANAGGHKLEIYALSGELKKTLISFPFSRVEHPAIAPDGRIAVVTNRDGPRRADAGGHLYVVAADGTGLKQLTRDPEEISSVAWSQDGKWIYAVRRISVGKDGGVGVGGDRDLHRISPETGEAVNLTRSGGIGNAWSLGEDLLVHVNAWNLPSTQRGLFRIPVAELEKATAGRRVPPVVDRERWGKEVAERILKSLGPAKSLRDTVPTPALLETMAKTFAAAVTELSAIQIDFSAESLDRLDDVRHVLDIPSGRHPVLTFGLGAYYGETLRRVAGAEWILEPVPFGDWSPCAYAEGTPLVEALLPFSAASPAGMGEESSGLLGREDLDRMEPGKRLLLIYPPASVETAVKTATGPAYYEAQKMVDKGDARGALDLLSKALLKSPKNRGLAIEAIAVCEATGMEAEAKALTERAVAGGCEVPEILMRHADALAAADAKKALEFYRKAAEVPWPPSEVFLKMGKAYASAGRPEIAASCWRRGYYRTWTEEKKAELRKLLGVAEEPKPEGE